MRKVEVQEAVGMRLAHDITKIVPGGFKGPVFRRGHIIREEDIPELLQVGKEHLFVLQLEPGEVHEEEAAVRIARAIGGRGLASTAPKEGRVDLKTQYRGLLKINVTLLEQLNSREDIIISTVHTNTLYDAGTTVAATRIIPLFITDLRLQEVEALTEAHGKVLQLLPIPARKIGIVITGSEVYKGRIEDRFGEIVQKKVEELGSTVLRRVLVPDDVDAIASAIASLKAERCDVIVACGGMSVDPDDVTREGIARTGATIVRYGAPVLPGSMFLYALLDGVAILGAPACVLHDPTTTFDLMLPRVLLGERLTSADIGKLGHGGLCLHCPECIFPVCPFGKE
ncbi:MAG: molybdopterin-binding protein [Chloroflexi bacterium]|nr:molybdopterin-binding protein [Chloroflexota bacterium]